MSQTKKKDITLKIGRYGIYIERGEEKANIPDDFGPENITYEIAEEMLNLKSKEDDSIGVMDGEEMFIKNGRFGAYLQCGKKTKGFPPNITPENIDEATASKILSLPTSIGRHPDDDNDVLIDIGKFGPYLRCGKTTKSIPATDDMFDVDLKRAVEILNTKQNSGKILGKDKESKKEIEVKRGRFGAYITDGKINVSLKNGEEATITLEEAIERIKQKAMKSK